MCIYFTSFNKFVLYYSILIMYILSFQEKCHQYWPSDRSVRYQCFVVDPIAEYNMPQYILREFKVILLQFQLYI